MVVGGQQEVDLVKVGCLYLALVTELASLPLDMDDVYVQRGGPPLWLVPHSQPLPLGLTTGSLRKTRFYFETKLKKKIFFFS